MVEPPDPADDALRRRLDASASGELAAGALRRRYERLHEEYLAMLQRLTELEARVDAGTPPPAARGGRTGLLDALVAPLLDLRDEYVGALSGIHELVDGIERLTGEVTGGAFKGQRTAEPEPPAASEARELQVDVRGRGSGALLAFQRQLGALPGVLRVQIHAIDNERATFVVELGPEGS